MGSANLIEEQVGGMTGQRKRRPSLQFRVKEGTHLKTDRITRNVINLK